MLVSISWLKKYVDIPVEVDALANDLTMLGLNVEHVTSTGLSEPLVVIGHVVSAEQHPNADRLTLCRVDIGQGDPVSIVCGAPNVAAGQKVPVALVGAKLPNGIKIRKSKIRGEVSQGMICSDIELGLGSDASGIMVLDEDLPVGKPFAEVLGPADHVLEIEVTPNRPDQLSHVGVAREIAALYEIPLKIPQPEPQAAQKKDACFSININDESDCYRFVGRVVRGVRVGPSPGWLREALERMGLSSINNLVDVGNYVMFELGQPTHTYDLSRLPSREIGVRRAREGEKLLVLDGKEYDFEEHYLLITDGDKPVGVAGVIGGEPTSVHDGTTDVLIESAAFNPRVIRATRKQMNINTDAAYRFERGSDREMCLNAANRVAELIVEVARGEIGELIDEYPTPWEERTIRLRRKHVHRILGLSLGIDEIASLLSRLSFPVTDSDDDSVTVTVPSYRADIIEETDLVEEVARLNGYDRIGQGWHFRTTSYNSLDPYQEFTSSVAAHLCARGHTEILTTSFTDGREMDILGVPENDPRRSPIEIKNPLSENHKYLRTSLLPSTLEVLQRNIDRGIRRVNVFNRGTVFIPEDGESGLPNEQDRTLIVQTTAGGTEFWNDSKSQAHLFAIKEEIETLLTSHRIPVEAMAFRFEPGNGSFTYSKDRDVVIEGGIVTSQMASAYGIEQPVWYADLDLRELMELRTDRPTFARPSEFPPSLRDLSLVAGDGVDYTRIEKSLVKYAGRLLESVQVFDVYQGEHLVDGKTAYGVRLTFRSKEGTLTDNDVDAAVNNVIAKLETELGVVLRS